MQRETAIKKLGGILGKRLGYRIDPKAPDQETRDDARTKLHEALPKREVISKQMEARRIEILQADAEYQRLKAELASARKQCDYLSMITRRYRVTVGIASDLFFEIKAQGDSWEDVIGKLIEKQAA